MKSESEKKTSVEVNLSDLLAQKGAYEILHDVATWIETEWVKGPNAQLEDAKINMLKRAKEIRKVAHSMLC